MLLNDGSKDLPKLRIYFNLGTLSDLPKTTIAPKILGVPLYQQLLADGFEGVQGEVEVDLPIPRCGSGRIDTPAEADTLCARHVSKGDPCITIHAGRGLEDDDQVFQFVEAILTASQKHRLPVFLETHRATITQDIWRTVQIAKKFPDIRFNGDFSHYYCGQEMVYGDMKMKLDFMQPIFDRIGFLHGRIASPGCMQVPVDSATLERPVQAHGGANYLADFKEMWIRSMAGFLGLAEAGDILIFAPEILSPKIYYARMFPDADGNLQEESDRYKEALIYKDLAKACFLEAQKRIGQ